MTDTYAPNDRPDPRRETTTRRILGCEHTWERVTYHGDGHGWHGERCVRCGVRVSREG